MTELTLRIETLRRFNACDLHTRVDDITRVMGRVLHEDEEIPLRTWWDLDTTSVVDMWWSLRCLGEPGQRIGVEAACLAARRVLRRTPEQDRPACLAAIEAAEGWLRGDVTHEECREAASAAGINENYDGADEAACDAAAAAINAAAAAINAAAAYVAASYAVSAAAYVDASPPYDADVADAEREHQRADLYRLTFGD